MLLIGLWSGGGTKKRQYLEHKTGGKAQNVIKKSGKFGPAIGSLLGIVPQCGFSAAAANFYAGRVISLGTLIAIFLSIRCLGGWGCIQLEA